MDFVRHAFKQLLDVWANSSIGKKSAFVATCAIAVAVIGGVGWWASQPQYIPLASNLAPTETADLVSLLNGAGIANKLNFSGSTVLVPKQRWNDARIAAGDLADSNGGTEDESLKTSFLGDPTLNQIRVQRAKERELENSLKRFRGIEYAKVQIAQPEWTPFPSERQPTTASVVVGIRKGAMFARHQATSVATMVASSVEGLLPENVTVTDLEGNILSNNDAKDGSNIGNRLHFQQQLETDLASKAEVMLGEMLGDGHAIVRVTADVDFKETERVDVSYNEDGQVKEKEIIESSKSQAQSSNPVGPAGTSTNVGVTTPAVGSAGRTPVIEQTEKTETDYKNAMVTDKTRIFAGNIKRLTVAAMVDLSAVENSSAAAGGRAPIGKQQIESVIKQAVGFDETRNDQIEVLLTPLVGMQPATPIASPYPWWEIVNSILKNGSLGIAALVALALGILILRKLKPITVKSESESKGPSPVIAKFQEQAKNNPELVSKIISAWMDVKQNNAGDKSANTEQQQEFKRAA